MMVLFLLYSALGFLAVPYYLKNQLTELSHSQLNSQLSLDNISFNPYTVALNVSGLKLTDTDKNQWFRADELHANLDLWKTLFSHSSISKIHFENPHYQLVLDGSKKAQVKYPQLNIPDTKADDNELQLDIRDLSINQGSVTFDDGSKNKAIKLNFADIQLFQTAFSTADQELPFDLKFTTESDHTAEISGFYNFAKTQFKADWKIENWATKTLLRLSGKDKYLGLSNHSGAIDALGQINYSQSKSEDSAVIISQLVLNNFNSSAITEDVLKVNLPQLTITHAEINLNQNLITVEDIKTAQNDISLGVNETNDLLWNPQTSQSSSDTSEIKSDGAWQVMLKNINIEDSNISISKPTGQNVLHLTQLNIKNLGTAKSQQSEIEMTGTIDESGQIQAQAQLQLLPFELSTDVKLNAINLKNWQAWVPSNIHIKLQKGRLSTQQHITVSQANTISQGWIKLEDAALVDASNHEFFSIGQLQIKNNTININDRNIDLDRIVLDQARGDLLVSEDKILNLTDMVSDSEEVSSSTNSNPWTITINSVDFKDAQTSITDKSVKPNYHSQLSKIQGSIKGLSSQNLSKADVQLSGLLDTYGKLSITGQINPLSDQAFTDLSINIENLDMQNFSSYSGQYLGFPVQRGKADFSLQYKLNQYILKGKNSLVFKQLKFGDKTNSKDAINLPLKLAISLLTDGKGVMKINLPVSGNINDPEFSYGGLVFKAFFKLITGIVASPFKLLGKLIPNGDDLDLSGIQFKAGTAELKTGEQNKLQAMQAILQKRPKLNLELTAVINSIEDDKALKSQQLLEQLKLTQKPELAQLNSLRKEFVRTFSQQQWQQLMDDSSPEQQLNQEQLLDKAWIQLLEAQNIDELLNHLSANRAQFIQTQLIDQLSVAKERIFIRISETSESLYPQVKFGIAGL